MLLSLPLEFKVLQRWVLRKSGRQISLSLSYWVIILGLSVSICSWQALQCLFLPPPFNNSVLKVEDCLSFMLVLEFINSTFFVSVPTLSIIFFRSASICSPSIDFLLLFFLLLSFCLQISNCVLSQVRIASGLILLFFLVGNWGREEIMLSSTMDQYCYVQGQLFLLVSIFCLWGMGLYCRWFLISAFLFQSLGGWISSGIGSISTSLNLLQGFLKLSILSILVSRHFIIHLSIFNNYYSLHHYGNYQRILISRYISLLYPLFFKMHQEGSTIKVGIINGSLRRDSNNAGLARVVESLKPNHVEIVHINIDSLPLMNEDLELFLDAGKTVSLPGSVNNIRSIVRQLDALLFSSPQNNGGVSGALKNAYDWLSRDYTRLGSQDSSPMNARLKLGIIGGSYISDASLKDIKRMVQYNKVNVFPETYYIKLSNNFDEHGNLINREEESKLAQWSNRFYAWISQHQ